MKKLIGLLAGFALATGLIGAGVGAQFTGQVSAQENLNVGTFGCQISTTTQGVLVVTNSTTNDSLYYDAGTIDSSALGSRPLNFTVTTTGTIPVQLNIAATMLPTPFVDLLTIPVTPVVLSPTLLSYTFNAGISWPELTNTNLGQSASIAYVVNCTEVGANPVTTVAFSATGGTGYMNDTITGTGFLQNGPLTLLLYRFGSSTPQNLGQAGVTASWNGTGGFTANYGDDCHPTPANGTASKVDMPVVVWASDGTRSAIGTGIIPCSKF
jgi:hypothetical protein